MRYRHVVESTSHAGGRAGFSPAAVIVVEPAGLITPGRAVEASAGRRDHMIWQRPESSTHGPGEFARARAQAETDAVAVRGRAARTVADQAIDREDLTRLLAMLGLDEAACGRAAS
jgi:hypothetical protein